MDYWKRLSAAAVLSVAVLAGSTAPTRADQGDCSQPVTGGASPAATDCLFILNAAVGAQACDPECICAPSGSLPISATDALICLARATGQPVALACPCTTTTTSTTTSSTTTTTVGAPPDIRGTYVGELFVLANNCVPPEDGNTTFTADGSITIDMQAGASFSGSGLFTVTQDNTLFTLMIDLDGTVDALGGFNGSYTETFVGEDGFSSAGSGTYAGGLVFDTMTFDLLGTDTDEEGTTCDVDADFAGER